jgi:nitrile hydratase subunit beta
MDGIHDLGGREGFGPVRWKPDEHGAAFHEAWQARTWAICMCMFARWRRENNGWTLDWWRHVLERIEPADYLAMNYFDKWAQSCIAVLVDEGTADINDFVSDVASSKSAGIVEPGKRANVRQAVPSAVGSDDADASKAMFEVGDTVTGILSVSAMHTRLPAYARGRSGLVSTHHGMQILPDASARGEIRKEHLYTVAFKASDLWPEATDRKDKIYIDLWESYLEPAR